MPTAAANRIRGWREDPVRFVRENFDVEPDAWQHDALQAVAGKGVRRLAMRACVGPGKSAVLAWLGWWVLGTHGRKGEHPKGAAVSITRENLADNLWTELAKWQGRSEYLSAAFTWTKSRIFANDHPETWFLSSRGFAQKATREELGRTLSGLHSEFPFILLDESGDMPTEVGRAAEQAMSGDVCGLIAQAGNPTSKDGLLYASAVTARDLWTVVTITSDPEDPKRTPRVSKEWAQSQIDLYGRDNPWVMTQILGQFPPAAPNALLGVDEVEAALGKHLRADQYEFAARLLGVDVARFGDDRTVIFPRQGLASFQPVIMRNARTEEIAAAVSSAARDPEADAIFVDGTGGYGAGTVDALRLAGWSPIEVVASGAASSKRFANLRAEMWWKMAEWVKGGGALPPIPELVNELTVPTYCINKGAIQIEAKDQIKLRVGRSPDIADALAQTFAREVKPKGLSVAGKGSRQAMRGSAMDRLNRKPQSRQAKRGRR